MGTDYTNDYLGRMKRFLLGVWMLMSLGGTALGQDFSLEKGWKFYRGDAKGAERPDFDDSHWETVRIPHDWAIYGPFSDNNDRQTVRIEQNGEKEATTKTGRTGGLPYTGIGWYRCELPTLGELYDRVAYLEFDGAMSHARVYVNGAEVAYRPYGYVPFWTEVTKHLTTGRNVLAVRLENKEQSSRWYPGAGLYRNVTLRVKGTLSVQPWSISITTPEAYTGYAKVHIRGSFRAEWSGAQYEVRTYFLGPKGDTVKAELFRPVETTQVRRPSPTQKVVVGDNPFDMAYVLDRPKLWSPESPSLYTAITELVLGKRVIELGRERIGIRSIDFSKAYGFRLNEKVRKLKGVCLHHDLGPLGAAVNKAALKRQLTILKDLGVDAIRTTHNPPAPELIKLADEMGFFTIVEAFDEWKTPKVKNGYAADFDAWAEQDVANMVQRFRNSPSVILWSIGNEVPDQWAEGGVERAKRLQAVCHREDPSRRVTAGMDQYEAVMKNGFAAALDVAGFNYKPHKYREALAQLPVGFLYGSETASTVSSRGVYEFPALIGKNVTHPDGQSSSYDLEYCWWSQLPEDEWAQQDSILQVMGEFVWTGFDYLGEPTPYDEKWPSHSSYFGICDLAGLPKDRYYLYRSRWNTAKPTLHALPHWTWPGREGQTTPVYVYTSYPKAELFVNGKSQGVRTFAKTGNRQDRYRLRWNEVVYQPGNLEVVAYNAQGKEAERRVVQTAGKPAALRLEADRTRLKADGKDLAFVTVSVVDADGNLCPQAADELRFAVTGAGSYRAAANGDPTCLTAFHEPKLKAFSGKLVVLVQAAEQAGPITLTVTGAGLKEGVVGLVVE